MIHIPESFVGIRQCGDVGSPGFNGAVASLPVERIAPRVVLKTCGPGLFEDFEKMNRARVVRLAFERFGSLDAQTMMPQ